MLIHDYIELICSRCTFVFSHSYYTRSQSSLPLKICDAIQQLTHILFSTYIKKIFFSKPINALCLPLNYKGS